MDLTYFVEGPLLAFIFYFLIFAVLIRSLFFVQAILASGKGKRFRPLYWLISVLRAFIPFHKGVLKKPLYTLLRYLFHICLFAVPIWFSGHIYMWEDSSLEWSWSAMPDAWADGMTLALLGLCVFFLIRHLVWGPVRRNTYGSEYLLLVLTALPFLSGYFLTHGTLSHIDFFDAHLLTIHIISAEAMILLVAFLFCRTRLNPAKCVGCASCEINCPTGALEVTDTDRERRFAYSHYQCLCCATCVATCPEAAAELRHEISLRHFFRAFQRYPLHAVALQICQRCHSLFAPEPQVTKVRQLFGDDFTAFCPTCRKTNLGDTLMQLSPWHRKEPKERLSQPAAGLS